MIEETDTGGPSAGFQLTAWSVVRDAGRGSREALDQLVSVYWKPTYFFIRRRGHDVEAAKDLTQAFFGSLLDGTFFQTASAEKGRFRSYLLGALVHFLSDEQDRRRAQKRGGDYNFVQAEAELASSDPSPEKAFRHRWAREILSRAMARLRKEVSPEDLALLGGGERPELSVAERKSRLFRLRTRLRECLREQIRPSVDREEEVDSEIRELFGAFQ